MKNENENENEYLSALILRDTGPEFCDSSFVHKTPDCELWTLEAGIIEPASQPVGTLVRTSSSGRAIVLGIYFILKDEYWLTTAFIHRLPISG
jgi:hypothetical protein